MRRSAATPAAMPTGPSTLAVRRASPSADRPLDGRPIAQEGVGGKAGSDAFVYSRPFPFPDKG